MSLKIDQDYGRFRNIVRGKIREGLRKYISQGDMIGGKATALVSMNHQGGRGSRSPIIPRAKALLEKGGN